MQLFVVFIYYSMDNILLLFVILCELMSSYLDINYVLTHPFEMISVAFSGVRNIFLLMHVLSI